MTNEEYQHTLAQILLLDPINDNPKIHSKRKTMPKRQMIRRLEKVIQEYEEAEVIVDLSFFKESIERLKAIRSDREYSELIQEIVDSYDPNFGILEESSISKVPILESNTNEDSRIIENLNSTKISGFEERNNEKKDWISSFVMNFRGGG